jgi:NIMA (never in mitosis gene a)-related kinase
MNVSKVAKGGMLFTQTGTPYYASPEVWKDKPYDYKSDMWSLGCIIYEMASLHPPFRADDMQGLFRRVTSGVVPEIPRMYSTELYDLIKQLLQQNPSYRPSCGNVLTMPAVAKRARDVVVNIEEINKVMAEGEVLGTIVIPKNLSVLSSRLPKPNYSGPKTKRHLLLTNILLPYRTAAMLPAFSSAKLIDTVVRRNTLYPRPKRIFGIEPAQRSKSP